MMLKFRNKSITLLAIVVASIIFTQCGVKKKVVVVEEPKIPVLVDTVTEKPEDYLRYALQYNTFTGKADVHYQDAQQDQNLNVNIKMRKGVETYLSAQALGGLVEAAVALARPDSLFALDRINRKKYILAYDDGLELIKVPIPYSALQNLLLGNPILEQKTVSDFIKKDDVAIIKFKENNQELSLYYDRRDKRLIKQEIVDITKNFIATIFYNNYQFTNNTQSFAMDQAINILHNGKQSKITLNYSNVNLDMPIEYRFSIPKNYSLGSIGKKK